MPWLRLPTEKSPAKAWNIFRERGEGGPRLSTYSWVPKCHILIILNVNSEFRKSKVDPIFILDRRRTFLARFWTPQARLRPPNTTSESKMWIFKFHNFRSWYQEFKMIAEFSLEKNQWIQLNFVFFCCRCLKKI